MVFAIRSLKTLDKSQRKKGFFNILHRLSSSLVYVFECLLVVFSPIFCTILILTWSFMSNLCLSATNPD